MRILIYQHKTGKVRRQVMAKILKGISRGTYGHILLAAMVICRLTNYNKNLSIPSNLSLAANMQQEKSRNPTWAS